MRESYETYETEQPWVIYTYGRTHDLLWPFWTSTRFLGHAKIGMECCICGEREIAKIKCPRFGPVPSPPSGRHALREKFLAEHSHPTLRNNPLRWAKPLRNIAALPFK